MAEQNLAALMWTMGFGNSAKRFAGGSLVDSEKRRVLKNDWKTLPMPEEHTEIELDIPIAASDFEQLSLGHLPDAMEDHWFWYFDGESLCIHRSWTGFCIFQVHVRHNGQDYVLTSATANRDRAQCSQTSDECDRRLIAILMGEALGADMSELWDEWFELICAVEAEQDATPVGFWREQDELGCLSNWHASGFTLLGTTFATAEHWIMFEKARVMGDDASAAAVLKAKTPKGAKTVGGNVSPYDDVLWSSVREQLAYVGLREKFLQHPELARELLSTGARLLAEASPYDHVWGVGIIAENPGFADLSAWNGSNLQGRICMRVRRDLRFEGALAAGATSEEECDAVLASSLGAQTLRALTCNPLTRTSALTYARIAQARLKKTYHTLDDYLKTVGNTTLEQLAAATGPQRQYLKTLGLGELVCELAFLRRTGEL